MNEYYYKVIDENNKIIKGKINKNSENDLKIYLEKNNFHIIKIKKLNFLQKDINFNRNKNKKLIIFCKQISLLVDSGFTVAQSIKLLEEKQQYLEVVNYMEEGNSIYESFKINKTFPNLFLEIIKIGEQSGNISYLLNKMAYWYEKEEKNKKKLQLAMLYPSIILFFMSIVILFCFIYLVPLYAEIFNSNNIELHFTTRVTLGISSYLINNILYITIFLFFCLINIYYFLFYKFKMGYKFLDFIKINFNIYKKNINLIFLELLIILIKSDITFIESLKILKNTINNKYFKNEIQQFENELQKGNSIYQSLSTSKYLDKRILNMIDIGEKSGKLIDMLENSKNIIQIDLDYSMEKLNKLIEPIITIILGIVVGFIMISILLPILSISNVF